MRGVRKDLSCGLKECPKCLKTKSVEEFYIFKKGPSTGLPGSYCKECTLVKNKNRVRKIVPKEGCKICTACNCELPITDFYFDKYRGNKPRPRCKECDYSLSKKWVENNRDRVNKNNIALYYKNYTHIRSRHNEVGSKRRARLRNRPKWSDKSKVQLIFVKAKELSLRYSIEFHVDHVVPLRSKYVSGLHTEDNLQVLEKGINLRKKDLYWPDMPIIDKELKQMAKEFYAETN